MTGTSVALRGVTLTCVLACVGVSACSHAWDSLEPGATSSSGGGGGNGGSGTGGTGTTSTTGSASGGGGATSSSSGTGGSIGPVHCGGTDILSWDFSEDLSDFFHLDSGASLVDGEGVVELPADNDSYDGLGITSIRTHDLRGDRVFLKVTQVPNQSADTYAGLELDYDNGDDLFLGVYQDKLECGYDRGGMETLAAQVPYDPMEHRYWQLREDQGTIYCEASPDGAAWHQVGSFGVAASLLAPPSAIRVVIFAVTPDHVPMPGSFHFDDLNGALPPSGAWCKLSSLTDSFPETSDVPGQAWDRAYTSDSSDSFDQKGGTLNFHFGAVDWSSVGYESSVAFDMSAQRAAVQVLQLPASNEGRAYFFVGNNDHRDVYWQISAGHFECGYDAPGKSETIWQGAAPTLPAWIAVRESGGEVYCEIYEDGEWKARGSIDGVVNPASVYVALGAYTYSELDQGEHLAVFDSYNLAP